MSLRAGAVVRRQLGQSLRCWSFVESVDSVDLPGWRRCSADTGLLQERWCFGRWCRHAGKPVLFGCASHAGCMDSTFSLGYWTRVPVKICCLCPKPNRHVTKRHMLQQAMLPLVHKLAKVRDAWEMCAKVDDYLVAGDQGLFPGGAAPGEVSSGTLIWQCGPCWWGGARLHCQSHKSRL